MWLDQSIRPFVPLFDDAALFLSKGWRLLAGQLKSEKKSDVKYASAAFFKKAHAGNVDALATLADKGYGHAWNTPGFKGITEREIIRDVKRGRIAKQAKHGRALQIKKAARWPRGAMTGSPMYGYDKFADNLWGKQLKMNLGFGAALTVFSMATAPKGEMAKRGAESLGATFGSIAGQAIGGFLLGVPGELIGGLVGGGLGQKAGEAIAPLEEIGRQARHANFGGKYEDSEPAFSMRQRAVQEMGSSILNARQWLGKEASLLHQ